MTCLPAHIFLEPEVREQGTVHLAVTKQTNQLTKTLPLKCGEHHAYSIHCGDDFPGADILYARPDAHVQHSLPHCCAGSLAPQLCPNICRYHYLSSFLRSLWSPTWVLPGALPTRSSERDFSNTLQHHRMASFLSQCSTSRPPLPPHCCPLFPLPLLAAAYFLGFFRQIAIMAYDIFSIISLMQSSIQTS